MSLFSLSFWRNPPPARLKGWLTALVLGGIGFTTMALIQDIEQRPRNLVLALVPEEIRDLSKRSNYPFEDLLERARTIGVSSAFLRPQALSTLIDRGDVLHFSRAEAQKWIVAGLVASGSPLRLNALWVRDRDLFAHVVHAFDDRGISVSTQSLGSVWIANFPDSVDLPNFPIGFDPASLRSLTGSGLVPIFEADAPGELEPLAAQVSAAMSPAATSIFILGTGLWQQRIENAERLEHQIERIGARQNVRMAIFEFGTSGRRMLLKGIGVQLLLAGHARVFDGMSQVWRSVFGRGTQLLIVHLIPEMGVEENLSQLRAMASQLRLAGVSLDLPIGLKTAVSSGAELAAGARYGGQGATPFPPSKTSFEYGSPRMALPRAQYWALLCARYALAVFLAIFGPLLAMRQGLQSVRRIWAWQKMRPASPVPEIVVGLATVTALALVSASAVYALLFFDEWRLGLIRAPWFLWTTAVPVSVSSAALYMEELRQWNPRLKRPMTYRGALILGAFLMGVWFLLSPRQMVHILNVSIWTRWWNHLPDYLWWLGSRWREVLVGYPSLTMGLWLYYRNIIRHSGHHKEGAIVPDPRPWLVAALFGPSGILQVFGYARAPYGMFVLHTAVGAVLGLGLGSLLISISLGYRWACTKMNRAYGVIH